MENFIIRKYKDGDRDSIREIACDTADMGFPIESFFRDRNIAADFLTKYYTDYEPESLFVAEYSGKVVGYLTGCLDNTHYKDIMSLKIIPRMVIKAVLRGIFFRAFFWKFVKAGFITWLRGLLSKRVSLKDYPAHFHINIRSGFRGHSIGKNLVDKFIEELKINLVKGVQLTTLENNLAARRFFESLGFKEPYRKVLVSPKDNKLTRTIIYGKII